MLVMRGEYYINIKTKNIYYVVDTCINATNEQDGNLMVIYTRAENMELFCREYSEFMIKFRKTYGNIS